MKTAAFVVVFACIAANSFSAITASALTTSVSTSTGHSAFRQLQFFPPPNRQPEEFTPEGFPVLNGQQPAMNVGMEGTTREADAAVARDSNANGLAATGTDADGTGADGATTGATATDDTVPQGASAGSATSGLAAAAATTDIQPAQPTIMVIVPDFLAAGSGWSSYTGDVGETEKKEDTKPVEETPSSGARESCVLTALTAVMSVCLWLNA